jgi:hypothetical protein
MILEILSNSEPGPKLYRIKLESDEGIRIVTEGQMR